MPPPLNADFIYAGFVRQRRFLIALSLALAAFNYLDLELHEINVLGNPVSIIRPGRVIALCRVAWGWALWRYYQWFHDIEAWFQIKSAFGEDQRNILAMAMSHRPIPNQEKVKAIDAAIAQWKDQFPAMPVPSTPWDYYSRGNRLLKSEDGSSIVEMTLTVQRTVQRQPFTFGRPLFYDTPVTQLFLLMIKARALWILIVHRRYLNEYLAPFLFAVLPILARLL